jgi:hypothetical protein
MGIPPLGRGGTFDDSYWAAVYGPGAPRRPLSAVDVMA